MNDWWTPEDKEKFEERLQKLIDYYDNITVFEGVNVQGKIISAEATECIWRRKTGSRSGKTQGSPGAVARIRQPPFRRDPIP